MAECDTAPSEGREIYGFIYGEEHITYRVKREVPEPGKRRRIRISIPLDTQVLNTQVVVNAPDDATGHDIHDAVMKRAKWIHDNLQSFRRQQEHVQQRFYVSGEMQFYLGRRHVLKVLEQPGATPSVRMARGKLVVVLAPARERTERVKALVQQWYLRRAQHVFEARLHALIPQTPWAASVPDYRILPMTKQWGSCSARGTVMLNPHLVKAPRECIDYVILHELCHLQEHNHSERFYTLLSRAMPQWQSVKRQLDDMAELLLNE